MKTVTILVAVGISAVVSYAIAFVTAVIVARHYMLIAVEQTAKNCKKSIDQMEKLSQDFMHQVKEEAMKALNQISKGK